jgi:hypothetical protein
MKLKLILITLWLIPLIGLANVTIGIATSDPMNYLKVGRNVSGNSCSVPLGNIEIIEGGENADIADQTNVTYKLVLPVGFEFVNNNVNTINLEHVKLSGSGTPVMTFGSEYLDATSYTFTYTMTGTTNSQSKIVIRDLNVRCITNYAEGIITRGRYEDGTTDATVVGVTLNSTPHGYLSNRINMTSNTPVCVYNDLTLTVNTSVSGFNSYQFYHSGYTGSPFNTPTSNNFMTYQPSESTSRTYSATSSDGNCYLNSNSITVTPFAQPGNYTDLGFKKNFSVGETAASLTNMVSIPTNTTINFSYINDGTYNSTIVQSNNFYPDFAKIGNNFVNYEIEDNTTHCKRFGQYPNSTAFPNGLTVSNPSIPPDFFDPYSGYPYYDNYPVCENDPDGFHFRVDLTKYNYYRVTTIIAQYYINGVLTPTNIYNPTNSTTLYSQIMSSSFNPAYHNASYKVVLSIYLQYTSPYYPYNTSNFPINISVDVLPRWNPIMSGLPPAANDGLRYLCSSSNDTVRLQPNQPSGLYEYLVALDGINYYTPGTNGVPNLSATDVIVEGFNRAFVPRNVFTKLGSNSATRIIVRYTIGTVCPDFTEDTIAFTAPIGISFTALNVNSSSIFCATEQNIFTIQGDASLRNTQEFYWDFGDGYLIRDTVNKDVVTHTYSLPGEYKVRMRTLVPVSTGCSSDEIVTLNVGAKPNATFDVYRNVIGEPTEYTSLAVLTAKKILKMLPI